MAVFEVVSGGDRNSLIKRFERKSKQDAISQLVDFHLLNCTRLDKLEAKLAAAQANLSECLSVLAEAVLEMADIQAPPDAFTTTQQRAENFLAAFQGERTQPRDPECEATYTTHPGESLMGIANRQLRGTDRWEEIRDLNADRFPDMGPHDYYPPGTELKMPTRLNAKEVGDVLVRE